jgi:hypothetical protein
VDAVLDDLYAAWRPAGAVLVVAGRARVPWSRARQVEELFQPLGAPPFLVDRVAPDRRWGASAGVELGALTLHGGAWADLDALEPRLRRDDPSRGGRLAVALAGRWAPRPASDPDGPCPALGLGALVRLAEDGTARLDGALSLELSWRWLSALVEGLAATGDPLTLGGHATVQAHIARLDLGLRAERDPGAEGGGQWASAAEVGWNVTRDRKNRVSVIGWLRRDLDRGTPFDAIVVFLQASL